MHSSALVRVLRSTPAIGALTLGAASGHAACTTANGVVTCTGPTTTDEANTAVNNSPPPSVTLVIAPDATVVQGRQFNLNPNGFRFMGAVSYNNGGVVGTPGANVDFLYFGTPTIPTNTFAFTNLGTQDGAINAFNVGGTIMGTNSGTVTRGIDVRGTGAITFTNNGNVFNTSTFEGFPAIILSSSRPTFGTGADGVTRQSDTGGFVSATINGMVGIPASSTTAFRPQTISAQSVGGVDLTVNGRAGGASASSFASQSESTFSSSRVGGTDTRIQNSDDRSIGSDARVTIGQSARVTGVSVSSAKSATAVVNGTADGVGFGSPAVSVNATGQERSSRLTEVSTSNPFSLDSNFSGFERRTGGDALADISSTARVGGGVTAFSNAGSATVRVAGQVTAGGSSVSADATGENSTSSGRSIVRVDGSSESSSSFTRSISGGAALVSVASSGNISFGFVRSTGDASATVDNAGRIGTSVFVNSNVSLETASVGSTAGTVTTGANGTRTNISRSDSSRTNETLGGLAVVINRSGAIVEGAVFSNGARGVSVNNAGTITGAVTANSVGMRRGSTFTDRFNTTTVPATSGSGMVTVFSETLRSSSSNSTSTGGAALVEVASTGQVGDSVSATSSAADATVRVEGRVGGGTGTGNVFATSRGENTTNVNSSASRSDGSFEIASRSTSIASGRAARIDVAATGVVSGSAISMGDGSATIDNAGRIGSSAFSISRTNTLFQSANDSLRTITTDAAGVRTQVDRTSSASSNQVFGGLATIANRMGATIGGDAVANGVGGATIDNAGAIGRSVFLTSNGDRFDSSRTDRTVTTFAPMSGGGGTSTFSNESSSASSQRAIGGAVTGTYGGTVGVVGDTVFSGVNQNGTTSSTATLTGTIFGGFNGSSGGLNIDGNNQSVSRSTTQANGSQTRDTFNASRSTQGQVASTSTLTIAESGRISDAGLAPADVFLNSAGGDSTFTLNGGRVDGNVGLSAGSGFNTDQTNNHAATFTRAANVNGVQQNEVQQTQTNNTVLERRSAAGTATVRINAGILGADLNVTGTGRGAGSLGADVVMNGTLTGGLVASAFDDNSRTTTTDITTRTGPATVSRTTTTTIAVLPFVNRGGALVNVDGTVGGQIAVGTNGGPATVNLTGQANTTGDPEFGRGTVFVQAFDQSASSDTVRTSSGTSFFNTQPTSMRTTITTTPSGGVATLNIAANARVRAANASSVEGNVLVQGFAGSALNVTAGSRLVQTAGAVSVGATFVNTASTTVATFTDGVQTGSTATSTANATGGPAVLTNAGIIGSAVNPASVSVAAIGGAAATNTGTINGSLTTAARGTNRTTTTVVTNQNDPALRRTVATIALTAVGGTASVSNQNLVTGGVTAIGANGTVTNTGVIRGTTTLGGAFANFTTTQTTTSTAPTPTTPGTTTTTSAPSVANPVLFNQNYTLNQNGLLLGGVLVTGATTVDPSGATVRTSNVNAAINLNDGSITLGNITAEPNTNATVTLNGSGFVGVGANDTPTPVAGQPATMFANTPSFARFNAIDPTLGTTTSLLGGSRITGVQSLTKTGAGTFVIAGLPFDQAIGSTPAVYTLDVGTLRNNGGELQLALGGTNSTGGVFGIRGNVENNANLVLGRRIVSGTQTAIQGLNISVLGNVTNAAAGNLIVGANATFVRPSPSGPFVAFTPASPFLQSTNSFVRVDGNLNLAGNVVVQSTPGGLFEAGRVSDLFSVSGTYANTGTVRSGFASPFVTFTLTPRTEGGRTIVSLDVGRAAFNTVTTDDNATAAANALQATVAPTFAALRGTSTANAQDLASIISALDTQLTADQAAQVFQELSSGEFYGSLTAVSTTIPFGEATDGLPTTGTGSGIGVWIRPTGQFALYKANRQAGASEIEVDNYGGSIGLDFATGSGGHIGIGGGYAKLDVNATTSPEDADAKTYMAGIYGAQQIGGLHLSAQAVYGKSKWDASRVLPTLGRTATGRFDSDEIRASVRAAYTIVVLPNFDISPFAKAEFRRTKFDAFTETGAGAVSLNVSGSKDQVFSPEVGLRMAGLIGTNLRPFAEGSYVFQGNVGSDRILSFVGGVQDFKTIGVDPGNAIKAAIGVIGEIAGSSAFIRGDYHSGGRQQVGTVRGGLLFSF